MPGEDSLVAQALQNLNTASMAMHQENKVALKDLSDKVNETAVEMGKMGIHMKDLVGNGKPGRVGDLENRVSKIFKYVYIGAGIVLAVQILVGIVEFYVHVRGFMQGH